jgi:hypothetical protein
MIPDFLGIVYRVSRHGGFYYQGGEVRREESERVDRERGRGRGRFCV